MARTKEVLSEEEWKIRDVLTKLSDECPAHPGKLFGSYCSECGMDRLIMRGLACSAHRIEYHNYTVDPSYPKTCYKCDREKMKNSPEGDITHQKYGRADSDPRIKLTDFDSSLHAAFLEARKRYKLEIMEEEEARKAVRLLVDSIGKPDLNYNFAQGTGPMRYRSVLWGVNMVTGVKAANDLAQAGITNFKITTDRWLTIWIRRDLTVRGLLKKGK